MEKPDLPSPTVLSFPDLAEPPAAGSVANKRLLESRGAEDGPEADESLKVVAGDEPQPLTSRGLALTGPTGCYLFAKGLSVDLDTGPPDPLDPNGRLDIDRGVPFNQGQVSVQPGSDTTTVC